VYVFNEEYKAIKKEALNGMVKPLAYLVARTVLELPLMVVLSFCSVAISLYGMAGFDTDGMAGMIFLNASVLWAFESMAQCFSVQFDNPLLGMLQYVNMWFSAFLFADFFAPMNMIIWPFRLLCYLLPFRWSIRGMGYLEFRNIVLEDAKLCDPTEAGCMHHPGQINGFKCTSGNVMTPCYGRTGDQVLASFGTNFRSITPENTVVDDILVNVAIAVFFKAGYTAMLTMKTRKAAKLGPVVLMPGA
jgi:hypothetical protein